MSAERPTVKCLRCGNVRRHEGRRLCKSCHRSAKRDGVLDNYPPLGRPRKKVVAVLTEPDPIEQMQAVRGRGGIVRWIKMPPSEETFDDPALAAVYAVLQRTLARPHPAPTCDQCGCLLKHADETCPGCLAWAERDAVLASWRRPIDTERSVA